jgi:hypothetical protein|tara:strand:+ start:491 stop:763 length:273 start_codon:yes stop_codon:yes gene_type:complete
MEHIEFSNYGDMLYSSISVVSEDLYVVVKYNKRLYIMNTNTNKLLYSPANHLRVVSRDFLKDAAKTASIRGRLTITDIVEFEKLSRKKKV